MINGEQNLDVEQTLTLIEERFRRAGHRLDADAIERARRMLQGRLTEGAARAEIAAKYGLPLPSREAPR